MKRLRTVIFWAHLLTGITIGSIVVTMAATGVLLTYQRQIQTWADTRGLAYSPASAGVPLAPDQLIARVQEAQAGRITGVRWRRAEDAPVEVELGRETLLFVDAYTGAILGDGSQRTRAFFRTITELHRWLALRGRYQATGRAITGAANLALLLMLLSGFYLWWPRQPGPQAFRNVMLFRHGLRPKARDFNWHNVIGFWSLLPVGVIAASAVVISYGWAGSLLERATSQPARVASEPAHVASQPAGAPSQPDRAAAQPAGAPQTPGPDTGAATDLLGRAQTHVPRWRSVTMQIPARNGAVTFIIDTGTGGQPQRTARLTLAQATGAVLAWQPFASESRAARVRSILRYAHTGEVLGVAGQALAGLVSAGTVLLAGTGIALALRRLAAWRRRRSPGAAA
jgi:uncharacterized iron-regulated membrane protein